MQEVKYRVVRKKLKLLKEGDLIKNLRGEVVEVLVFNEHTQFDTVLNSTQPIAVKKINGERYWPTMAELYGAGFIADDEFLVIEDVAESATTKAIPAPETRIIPIDGERFTVTRKPCGGWSEPAPWSPAVGDEVALNDLSDGDLVLIEGVYHKQDEHDGQIGVMFKNMRSKVKWFQPRDRVIYNGRVE